jgi:hypothetical protein
MRVTLPSVAASRASVNASGESVGAHARPCPMDTVESAESVQIVRNVKNDTGKTTSHVLDCLRRMR